MTPADAASILPRKVCDCEFKQLDDATGAFSMYALVFGNVDRGGDLIEPGAVQNIDEFVRDGWIALNHDQSSLPIATIDSAVQDLHGLKLTGTFHSTPEAQAVRTIARERMDRGKSVKTSIGYVVPVDGERYERIDGRPVRHLSKMSVYEASFVNLPMNPEAEVQEIKSLEQGFDPERDAMSEAMISVKALKRFLGLASKGEQRIDGENLERMKALADKCSTAAKSLSMHHKSMKDLAEECVQHHGELAKSFKFFRSGQQQPQESESEGPVADEKEEDEEEPEEEFDEDDKEDEDEEETPRKKARRGGKQDDEDEDSKGKAARKAFRSELQRRLLASRYSNL